ncbi:hypothetical protein CEXT_581831 [Caerostris extrusa]|uniref:Uncharacterized protein n=1 Tax=Caerostris extrusa TaxID=172846 RepID=A0AAV4R0R4_CAEEX|nr:hypothetical protein CEXT_581831 [Caerostris extrusa]
MEELDIPSKLSFLLKATLPNSKARIGIQSFFNVGRYPETLRLFSWPINLHPQHCPLGREAIHNRAICGIISKTLIETRS